jgi:hypothetical protein
VLCGVRTFLDGGRTAAAIPQPTWGRVIIPALDRFVNWRENMLAVKEIVSITQLTPSDIYRRLILI